MKRFSLLAGAGSVLIFSFCFKNNAEPAATTRLLKRMTQSWCGQEPVVYNFSYDTANRLTSVRSADNQATTTFSYDTTGRFAEMVQENPGFKMTFNVTYNDNKPASAFLKRWKKLPNQLSQLVEEKHASYTVTNSQVSKINIDDESPEIGLEYSYDYDSRGNVIEINLIDHATVTYTYGTKKSPYPLVSSYTLADFSEYLFGAKNEILSKKIKFDASEENYIIQNTYDTGGYVTTSKDECTERVFEYE